MPLTGTSFARALLALLLVGVVALLAIVGTSLWLADRTRSYADQVSQARTARAALVRVFGLVQDAEIGERGYLLVGDRVYLEPYEAADREIPGAVAKLKPLFAAWPDQHPALDHLAQLIVAKLAVLRAALNRMDAGRPEEALEIVRSGRGRVILDEAREVFSTLLATLDVRLGASASGLQGSARALTWVTVAGGFLILLVAGGSAFTVVRYTRDLMAAQQQVAALNVGLEQRVRERTVDLARANEEVQRFAYIVSHDLRSPLVNVMGFTSELEGALVAIRNFIDRQPGDEADPLDREARAAVYQDLPEAIGFIRSSTSKMDSLINAILKLSREGRRVLRPEHIDMAALLEAAAANVRHRLSEANGELVIGTPMPNVISDRLALEQVFGNLLDNAVKYLDASRPGRVAIRGRQGRAQVVYEVEDNGRGIAPQDQERIFDLFRRAGAQDRPGEGIGLAHVRALVRRLGGDITVESVLGQGTTFRVSLPRDVRPLLGATEA